MHADAFTFDLKPNEVFEERSLQFNRLSGISKTLIEKARSRINDSWKDAPGGWAYEWSNLAREAELNGDLALASSLYGAARFPVAATDSRKEAYRKQLALYLKAASRFQAHFERKIISVDGENGSQTPVVLHIFKRSPSRTKNQPVLIVSGGVDTYKLELHRIASIFALVGGFTVVAIDMPGTGESQTHLTEQSDRLLKNLIDSLRKIYGSETKVGFFGLSFGGHWAAKLALTRAVDAAIDLGGPIGQVPLDGHYLTRLPNGMTGIVAHALGMTQMPNPAEAEVLLTRFSLKSQGLLDVANGAPLLAMNGENDVYIPREEISVFKKIQNAEAMLFEDASHCFPEKMARVMPFMVAWLRFHLHGNTLPNRLALSSTRALLPRYK